MAERTPAWVPRLALEDPDDFGVNGSAPHRAPADMVEAGQFVASLAQHLAAVVVRSHREDGLTVRDLASRIGASEDYLSGQLTGRYPVGLDDLARWAIALRDPSVLPVFDDLEGFLPPA